MEAWLPKVTWSHGPIWPKLSVAMHYLHTWFCLFSYYIMIITIQEICQWDETDPRKRNFIGGEKVLNAGHLTTCGKVKNDYDANNPSGSTQTLKQLSSNRCVFQKKNLKATV